MPCLVKGLLPSYNSLTDRHLSDYFCRPRIRRHLIRAGLINRHHEIISEAAYKMNMVRKEHKRRIKQMLTDAVVTKSVDLARCKEMKLQRRLEEISKIEAVKKVKDDNMKTSDYQNTYLSSQAAHGILDTQNSRPVSAPEPPSSSKKFLHLEGSKPKHGRKLKKRILPQYVVRPKSAAMPQTHPYGYHPANLAFTPHPPDFLKPVYDKEMDPVPVGKDGTAIVKMNNVDTQVYPYLLAPTPPTSPPPDTPPYTSTSPKRTVRSMQGLPLSDRPGENDQDSGFICATCKSRNLALVNKGVNTYHSQQKPFSDDHDEESFPKPASTLTEQNFKIIDPGEMHDKKQQTDNEIKAELEILGSTMDFQQQTDENVLHTAQQTDKETTKDILIITHDSTQQTDGDVEADSGEVPCSTDDVSSENIQSKHEKHSIEKEILGVCDQVVDKVFKEIVAKKEQLSDSSYLLLNDDNFTATMSAKKIYDITPCIFDKNKICVRTTQHIYSISNKEQYSKYAKIKKNGELHSDFHSDNLYLIQDSGDLPVELNTVVQKKITGPISQKTIVGKSVENLQNVMKRSSDDANLQNQPILKLTAILKQTSLEHSYIPQNEFRKPAETMMNKDKREESKEMNIDKDSAAYFDEVNSDKNIDAMCDGGRISAILKKSDESIEIPVRKFSGTVETIPNTKKKRLVYTNKNLLENDDKAISGLKKEATTKDRDSDAIILTQEKYYQNEDEMQKIQNVPNKYSKLESTDKAVTKDNIREIPINQIDTLASLVTKDNIREVPINQIDTLASLVTKDNIREVPINQIDTFSNIVAKDNIREIPINQIDTFSNIVAKDNIREIPINQIDTLASLVTKDNIREVPINQIDTFSNVVAKDNIREVPINQIDSEKMPLMTENVDSNKIPFQDSESYLKLVYDNQYLSEAADKEVSVLHSNGSKLGTKNKKDDIIKDVVDTSWKENNLEEQLIYGETDSEKEIHRIIPIQQIEETNINIDDDNLNLPKKTVKTLDAKNKPLVKVTTILKNVDLADIPQNKIEMDRDKMKFDKSMPESKVSDNSEYKSVKDIPDSPHKNVQSEFFTGDQDLTDGCYRVVPIHQINTTELESNLEMKDFQDFEKKPETQTDVGSKVDLIQENGFKVEKETTKQPTMKVTAILKKKPEEKSSIKDSFTNGQSVTKGMHRIIPIQDVDGEKTGIMDKSEMKPLTGDRGGVRKGICRVIPIRDGEGIVRDYIVIKDEYELTKPMYSNSPIDNDYETIEDKVTNSDIESITDTNKKTSFQSIESYLKEVYSDHYFSEHKYGATIGKNSKMNTDISSDENISDSKCENKQHTMKISSVLKKTTNDYEEIFQVAPIRDRENSTVSEDEKKNIKERCQKKGSNEIQETRYSDSQVIQPHSEDYDKGDTKNSVVIITSVLKKNDNAEEISGTNFRDEKKYGSEVDRRIQIKQISELTDAQYQTGKEKSSEFDTAKNTTVIHSSIRDILIEQPGAIYEKSQSLVGSGKNALYKDLDSQQNQLVEIKKTMNIKDAEILTTEDNEPFVQKDSQISSESVESYIKHTYSNVILSRMKDDVNETSDIYSSEPLKNKESENSKKKHLNRQFIPQDQYTMQITSNLKKKHSIPGEVFHLDPPTASERKPEVINSDLKDVKEKIQLKDSKLHQLDQKGLNGVSSDAKDVVEQSPLIKITSILQRAGDISQNEIKDVELVKDTEKNKKVSGTHFEDEKKHCNKVERRIQIKQISELTDAQYQAGKEKPSEFDTAKNTTVVHSSVRDILIEQPGAIYEKSQSLVGSGKNALYKDLDSQQNQLVEIKKTMNIKDAEILTTEDSEPFVQKDAEKQISSESVELHMQHVYNNVFLSRMTEDVNEASDIYSSESNLKNKESKNSKKKILYSESVPQDQSVMKITSVLKKKRSISGEILNVEPATVSEVNREVINSDLKDVKEESQLKSSELHHLDQEDPKAVFSDTKDVVEQSPLIKITSILQRAGDISQNEIKDVELVKDTEKNKKVSGTHFEDEKKHCNKVERRIQIKQISELTDAQYQAGKEKPSEFDTAKNTTVVHSSVRDILIEQPGAIYEKSQSLVGSGKNALYKDLDSQQNQLVEIKKTMNIKDAEILTTEDSEPFVQKDAEKQISSESVELHMQHVYNNVFLSRMTEDVNEASDIYSSESNLKNKESKNSKKKILYSESVPQDQSVMKITSVLKKKRSISGEILNVEPATVSEVNREVINSDLKDVKEESQLKSSELHHLDQEDPKAVFSDTKDVVEQSPLIKITSILQRAGDISQNEIKDVELVKDTEKNKKVSGTHFEDEKKHCNKVERRIQIKQISELTDAQYQAGKEKPSEFDTAKNTTVVHSSVRDILIEQPGAIYEKSQSLVGSGKNALYKDLDSQQNQLVEIKKTMNIKDAEILTTEDSEPFVQKDAEKQISSESVELHMQHVYNNVFLSRMTEDVNEASDIYSSESNLKNKESKNSKKKILYSESVPQDQSVMKITSVLKKKRSISGEILNVEPATVSEVNREVINSDLKDVKKESQLKSSELHHLYQEDPKAVFSDTKYVVEQSPLIKITSILQKTGSDTEDISQNEIENVEPVKDTERSKEFKDQSAMKITSVLKKKHSISREISHLEPATSSEENSELYQLDQEVPEPVFSDTKDVEQSSVIKITSILQKTGSDYRDVSQKKIVLQPEAIFEKSETLFSSKLDSGRDASYREPDSDILTTGVETSIKENVEKISPQSVESYIKHIYSKVYLSLLTESESEKSGLYSHESDFKNKNSEYSKGNILYSESVPQDQSVMKITSVLKKTHSISREILNVEPATDSDVNTEGINSDLKDVKEESQLKSSELHHLDQEDPEAVFSDTKYVVEQSPLIKITSILQKTGSDTEDISQNEIENVEPVKDPEKRKEVSETNFESKKKHDSEVEGAIQINHISELTDTQYQGDKDKSSEFDTAENTTVLDSSNRDVPLEQPEAIYEKSESFSSKHDSGDASSSDLDSQDNQFAGIKETMNAKDPEILTTEDIEPFIQEDVEQTSLQNVEPYVEDNARNNAILFKLTDGNEASDIHSSESNLQDKEKKHFKRKIIHSESVPHDQSDIKIISVLRKTHSITDEILYSEPVIASVENNEVSNSELKDINKESQLKDSELHQINQKLPEVFSDTNDVQQSPMIDIASTLPKTGSDCGDISQNEIENVEFVKDTEESKKVSFTNFEDEMKNNIDLSELKDSSELDQTHNYEGDDKLNHELSDDSTSAANQAVPNI